MKYIFVDGYNVINSWSNLNNLKNHSYESARTKLIDLLQNYAEFNGTKVILVFDAHMVKGSLEKKERLCNLTVVFTKTDETADSYIERVVNSIGRKSEVYVVTSDSLEQQLVFQRGAIRVSSLEFYHWVNNENIRIAQKCKSIVGSHRNLFEEVIDKEIAAKLEKIRRSKE